MNMEMDDDVVGRNGSTVIPIFMKNDDGTLVHVAYLSRGDCVGMRDLYEADELVKNIVRAAGVNVPQNYFFEFEIPLHPDFLDGADFFMVPHDLEDIIFAVERVVVSYHAPDAEIQINEGEHPEVIDPEV